MLFPGTLSMKISTSLLFSHIIQNSGDAASSDLRTLAPCSLLYEPQLYVDFQVSRSTSTESKIKRPGILLVTPDATSNSVKLLLSHIRLGRRGKHAFILPHGVT